MCKKVQLNDTNIATAVSLPVCRLYCNEDIGIVWPKPTGVVKITNDVVVISPDDIKFITSSFKKEPAYWTMAQDRFYEMQKKMHPKRLSIKKGGRTLTIEVVADNDDMGKTSYKIEAFYYLIFLNSFYD